MGVMVKNKVARFFMDHGVDTYLRYEKRILYLVFRYIFRTVSCGSIWDLGL